MDRAGGGFGGFGGGGGNNVLRGGTGNDALRSGMVDDRGNPYVGTQGGGIGIGYTTPRSAMANPLDFLGVMDPTGLVSIGNEVGHYLEPDRVISTLGRAPPLRDYRGIANPNGVPQNPTAMAAFQNGGAPTMSPVARAMAGAMPSSNAVSQAARANVAAQLARPGGSASSMYAGGRAGGNQGGRGGSMGGGGSNRAGSDRGSSGRGFR